MLVVGPCSFEAEPDEVDCPKERCHRNGVEQDLLAFSKKCDILIRSVKGMQDVGCAVVVELDEFSEL